jgi:hypothetical protein
MPFVINTFAKQTEVNVKGAIEPTAYEKLAAVLMDVLKNRLSGPLKIGDSNVNISVTCDAMTFYLPTSVNIPALLELIAKNYTKLGNPVERREVVSSYYPNILVRKSTMQDMKIAVCNVGESTAPATGDIVFAASHNANVGRLKADTGELARNRFIVCLAKVSEYPNSVIGMNSAEWYSRILFGYVIDDSNYTTFEAAAKSASNPIGATLVENFNYPRDIRMVRLWQDTQCVVPVHIGRPSISRGLAYPTEKEKLALEQREISPVPFKITTIEPYTYFMRSIYPPDEVGNPIGGDSGIRKGEWSEVIPYLFDPEGRAQTHCYHCREQLYGNVYVGLIRRGVIPQPYAYVYCTKCAHDASIHVEFFASRYEIVMLVQHPRSYREELTTRDDLNTASREMLLDMLEGRRRALYSRQFEMDRFSNEHATRYVVTLVDFGDGIIGTTDIDKVMTSALKDEHMVATATRLVKIVPIGQHYSMII